MTEAETTTDDSEQSQEYVCDDCGATFDVQQEYASHRNQCDEGEESDDSSDESDVQDPSWDVIIDGSILQDWIEDITSLVDECRLHVDQGGFNVTAVDPANVGMIDTNLLPKAFESYDVPTDTLLGVNLERLQDVLKGTSADQLVSLRYDAETAHLIVRYGGHEFNLALIVPDSIRKEPDIPDLDLPCVFTTDARTIKDSVKFGDQVSDHIMVQSVNDDDGLRLRLVSEGDTDDYTGEYDDGEFDGEKEVEYKHAPAYGEAHQSLYSLDYLNDIQKTISVNQQVTVRHGTDFPIIINAAITGDQDDDDDAPEILGNAKFVLAPRIQSD